MKTLEGYLVEPCPFCGGENLGIHGLKGSGRNIEADEVWKYVQCLDMDCQSTGPVDLGVSGAIDGWNTRAIALKRE